MTCIIGLVDGDTVYIGGDSAGVGSDSISIRTDEKVFVNGPFIMGFTTSFRMGQLLQYKFEPSEQTVKQTDMEYMVTNFIDGIRKTFKDGGFGDGNSKGGNFLVGYKNKLYTIHSDFQVATVETPFDAVGAGEHIALGALYATKGMEPVKRIKLALDAASTFSVSVAPPFRIVKLTTKPKSQGNKRSGK